MIQYIGNDQFQVDVVGFSGVISREALEEITDEYFELEEYESPEEAYERGRNVGYSVGLEQGHENNNFDYEQARKEAFEEGRQEGLALAERRRENQDKRILNKMNELQKEVRGY